MKKFILLFILFFLTTSCREEIVSAVSNKKTEQTNFSNKNSESAPASLSLTEGELKCGNSNGSQLTLDPNIALKLNYNVSFWDGSGYSNCLQNGRQCVDLSHFLGILLPKGKSTPQRSFKIYYGGAIDYNTTSQDMVETFTIGETNNDGSAFGGNPYISDENTNKILQAFTKEINKIKRRDNGKIYFIKSYEIYTNALLCIPPYKFVTIKIRYIDPIYDPTGIGPGIPADPF
ncbi:hypothetical protein [Epilithonimonas hispanica]|uniref:Lipoprotein n=1 Tax=Epilithonimonas hispanica TaxID=358687 RepID=A0A3D9CQB2_9FLAO|nr:hypothetical protein [Epilithonimonas hispanica]REC67797.1 hypothetical protein DRF58_14595 [Epilithonimonas hispanica]